MQTLFDKPPPEMSLLDELEIIDKALLEGDATPEQERRGLEIVEMCNHAPHLKTEVQRLTAELDIERRNRKDKERDSLKSHRELAAYKYLHTVYQMIKADAEKAAQDPFDDHFRECLYALQAIAADTETCTCNARGWHGEGHDSQCPIGIAEDACIRADKALGDALTTRSPGHYQLAKTAAKAGGRCE